MDRILSMQVFVTVAELGSFSKAALQLDLSQAAISSHIAGLESRFGVRLINRTTRRLSLTTDGGRYLSDCRRILADIEATEESVSRSGVDISGRLVVELPLSLGQRVIAPRLPLFLERYPKIELELLLRNHRVNLVAGAVDVALRVGALEDSGMTARKLFEMRWVVCASPDYLTRRGTPVSPDDLSGHDCLVYLSQATEKAQPWIFEDGTERVTLDPKPRMSCNSLEALLSLAVQGGGIIHMSEVVAGPALAEGKLVALMPNWQRRDRIPVWALFPQRRLIPPRVRAFSRFASDAFRHWSRAVDPDSPVREPTELFG